MKLHKNGKIFRAGFGAFSPPSPTHSKKSSGFHSELLVSIFIEL
jgi:hypothetical protein